MEKPLLPQFGEAVIVRSMMTEGVGSWYLTPSVAPLFSSPYPKILATFRGSSWHATFPKLGKEKKMPVLPKQKSAGETDAFSKNICGRFS